MCVRVKPQLLILTKDQAVSRYRIPGENQIPEPRIFCCKVYTVGIPLITFSGNLPDRAFPGNARHTQESRSAVDRAFDFVPGCKLSLLPRYPNTCSSIAYRLFISRIARRAFHLLGEAAHGDKSLVQSCCIFFPSPCLVK